MRTAEQIRNDVAKTKGFLSWQELYQKSFVFPGLVDEIINEARKEALEECQDLISGNTRYELFNQLQKLIEELK